MAQFFPFSSVPKMSGTFSQALGTITAGTVTTVSFTVNGLTTDMLMLVQPTAALTTNVALAHAYVGAANTLTLAFVNPTAGDLAGGTKTFNYVAL